MDITKEYISFPWNAIPQQTRINFVNVTKSNVAAVTNELNKFHAKYEDGFIMFEDMKYYNWFLLQWS